MTKIQSTTSILELAAIVSEALEEAEIPATLSGGGAVTHYSDNEYMSTDLDFVTVVSNRVIAPVVAELGFRKEGKNFYHPASQFFLEFPPGPLSFGDKYIDSAQTELLDTKFGTVRIISPTQCVMDRLAWVFHGNDPQAREQAVMVARRNDIDWAKILEWAENEGLDRNEIHAVRQESSS